jgi:hypothetical protein
LRLRTWQYPLVALLAPVKEGGYRFSGGQALLKLENLIWLSPAAV